MAGEHIEYHPSTRETLAMIIADLGRSSLSDVQPVNEVDLEIYLKEIGENNEIDHELIFGLRDRQDESKEFLVVLKEFEQRKRKIFATAKIFNVSDLTEYDDGVVRFQLSRKRDEEPYRAKIKLQRGIQNIRDFREPESKQIKMAGLSILGGAAMVVAGAAIYKVTHKKQ